MSSLVRNIFVGAALLVVACSPSAPQASSSSSVAATVPAQTAEPSRSAKQTITYSSSLFPASASPESTGQGSGHWWYQFNSLLMFDNKLNLLPSAAVKWELLPDDSAWRFTIRQDLYFPNGDRLTAADVDFTMKNIIANKLPIGGNFSMVTGTRLVDDNTIDFQLKQRDVSTLLNAPTLFILPKKYYEQVGKDAFATKPMGSGPYDLVEYRSNDLLGYKLRTDRQHPFRKVFLSEVRYRYTPDLAVALAGLRTGELDMTYAGFTGEQSDLAKREGLNVIPRFVSNLMVSIHMATNERNNTPLTDKRVRLALNYAVDKEALASKIYSGYARPIGQLSVPASPMYEESNKPIPYDVAKAKQLLADAGYPGGFKLAGGLDRTPFHSEAVALAIQDYFKQIGVEIQINTFDPTTFSDRQYGVNGRAPNELLFTTSGDVNGMFILGRTLYSCGLGIACVPEFDRNMDAAYRETDSDKRVAFVRAANKAFIAETPSVFLLNTAVTMIASPKLKGLEIETDFWRLDTAYKID